MTIQKLEPENHKHAGLLDGEIAVSRQPAAFRLLIFAFWGWSSANPNYIHPSFAWTGLGYLVHCSGDGGLQLGEPLRGGEASPNLSHQVTPLLLEASHLI